jgi:hypothetical protein
VTIQSLIEQFTEYKHTVDEDKVQYEEKLAQADKFIRQEKAKNARTNQETIANLKTLMLELEMIEKKNQELHDELQQERVDHERTIAQLAETRDAHDDLEQDVQELKRELKQAKDTAAVNHLLSVRSGGSRIGARPGATLRPGGTLRPARPGAKPARRQLGQSLQHAARRRRLRRPQRRGARSQAAKGRAARPARARVKEARRSHGARQSAQHCHGHQHSSSGGSGVVPPTPLTARAAAAAAVAAAESAAKPAARRRRCASGRSRAKSSKVTIRNNLPPPSRNDATTLGDRRRQRRARRLRQASHLRSAASSTAAVSRRAASAHPTEPSTVPSTAELAAVRLREAIVKISESEPSMSAGSLSARHQRTCATIRRTRRNSPA